MAHVYFYKHTNKLHKVKLEIENCIVCEDLLRNSKIHTKNSG